ncbi:hypothetical protein SAMN04489751_1062 [Brevibacterium sandarakinum]|uniref:Major Facilitator Superfamily protein n=1 Tax=Brevibacterium sandarakinum TaxID=629680 RepID=A0A1H1NVT4_BRESA|nr:hypothetical protein [Brevibacterium sandarakinum]SDS03054.1 hypothetical protein SAMN04489751_1062 [Brevibacterium sandarakinum]
MLYNSENMGLELTGSTAVAGKPSAILILCVSALPAVIAIPLVAHFLSRWASRPGAAIDLLIAGGPVGVAAVLGENIIILTLALLIFVGGIAAAAPAIVELIHQRADGAIGASTALYTASMFLGTSIGPQIAVLLAPGGFAIIAGSPLPAFSPSGRSWSGLSVAACAITKTGDRTISNRENSSSA